MDTIQLDNINFDQHRTIGNNVYQIIKENIINWNLKPQTKISENDISELLKVSRTPVRESFVRLKEENLVNVISQKGTYVAPVNLKEVEDGFFIRRNMEIAVLKEALTQLQPKHIQQLEMILNQQQISMQNNDWENFFACDDEFHKSIYLGCNRLNVFEFLKTVTLQYARLRVFVLRENLVYEQVLSEHRDILNCIKNQEFNNIEQVISNHVDKILIEKEELKSQHPDYFF